MKSIHFIPHENSVLAWNDFGIIWVEEGTEMVLTFCITGTIARLHSLTNLEEPLACLR